MQAGSRRARLIAYGDDDYAFGGEQRMEPAARVPGVARNKQDAIGPTGEKVVGIVNAVGIEKPVTLGYLIAAAASAEIIENGVERVERKRRSFASPLQNGNTG